ncbi:MAG: hypothetical protein NZ693_10570, partial [Thermoflexales bacterium]|nr:hypothetical protein [Thermoflexales bacterium]
MQTRSGFTKALGAGCSTALANFAAQRACAGERVVIIDLDLAASGIGQLLLKPDEMPEYGVADYWLECPLVNSALRLSDYYARVSSIGEGEIFVF